MPHFSRGGGEGGRKFTFEAHWGEDAGGGQRNIPHAWRPRQAGSADYVWLNGWLVMCLMVCWSVCCGIVCLVACVLACCFLNTPSRCAVRAFFSFSCLRGTGGGSSPSAIMENTIFFFLSRRGGRVAKFHFATPTLSCFFLTNGLKIKFWNNYRAGRPGWGRAGLGPGPGARVPERLSGSRAFRRAARLRKECQGAECLSGSGPPNSVSL